MAMRRCEASGRWSGAAATCECKQIPYTAIVLLQIERFVKYNIYLYCTAYLNTVYRILNATLKDCDFPND